MPTYTTLYADAFTGANENPLSDNGSWTSYTGTGGCQILGGQCVQIDGHPAEASYYSGIVSFPNDQWAQWQVNAFGPNSSTRLYVRATATVLNSGYSLNISSASGIFTVLVLDRQAATTLFQINGATVNIGDVFRIVARGTLISAYQNGVLIGSASSSSTASGIPFILITDSGSAADTAFINFAAGSVASTPGPSPSIDAAQNITPQPI